MPEGTGSFPDHEHDWVPGIPTHRIEGPTRERVAVVRYRCRSCGMEITETTRPGIRNVSYEGPVSAYLHTCRGCGRTYTDGHPFSEIRTSRVNANVTFCSLSCDADTKERWRKEDLARLIPSLESMVAAATNEVARVLADERLRVIATDEDEPLRSQARDALKRARAKRKESPESHPTTAGRSV